MVKVRDPEDESGAHRRSQARVRTILERDCADRKPAAELDGSA